MIDINKKLQQFLSTNDENEILEYKEAKNQYDFDKIGKYFSSLSNEANLIGKSEAWLVFGIKDDKSVVGTNFRTDTKALHNLKAEVANHTTNRITFKEIYETELDGKRVVLFQIPSAPLGLPIAWKGHYYGRDSSELQPLNLEELERIRSQNSDFDWSIQICEDATNEDLSSEAIQKARELYAIKNPKLADEIKAWDDTTFLNKAKITIKDKITNTAILLLGKSESEYLLSPAVAQISWILKDKDNIAKDYEHFTCPFILSLEAVYNKIRNLKYRYMDGNSLFPQEVESYHPFIIREALNNCIAHQDYTMGGKINVVEFEDRKLVFANKGAFIPQTIENVLKTDAPEIKYRNKFLAQAMINLNLIDTIGSGIVKMFTIQSKKYFPLPEYELSNDSVKVTIEGKVLDMNYALKLASVPDLSLEEIILLDKVQKGHSLSSDEVKVLKAKNLIEGKRPNLHISSSVAKYTNQEDEYIKLRGIDDTYCQSIILEYLAKFKNATRADFEKILLDKLPDVLDEEQKKNKVKNNLQALRKSGKIEPEGRTWHLSKTKKV
ncbi:RNA-binding domain-containing protein [uncultured Arcobacter sp.]|uniref:RNA-binding domain-containing protein n=1 Tax=uncultured Arcobacter sp. TaxID=165434 RepID=UPI00261C1CB1|nr:RNA-binding domain-containing protein [uncultured Arcobacter sp.]